MKVLFEAPVIVGALSTRSASNRQSSVIGEG